MIHYIHKLTQCSHLESLHTPSCSSAVSVCAVCINARMLRLFAMWTVCTSEQN